MTAMTAMTHSQTGLSPTFSDKVLTSNYGAMEVQNHANPYFGRQGSSRAYSLSHMLPEL